MFEGESASVEITGDPQDRKALSSSRGSKNALTSRTPLLVATLVFALTITFGRDFLYNSFGVPFGIAATAASIAALLFFLLILNVFARQRVARDAAPRGTFVRNCTVTASPDGLDVVSKNLNAHYTWQGILSLSDTETHMFLYTDSAQSIIVPKRCFNTQEDASRFAIIVRSHLGRGV